MNNIIITEYQEQNIKNASEANDDVSTTLDENDEYTCDILEFSEGDNLFSDTVVEFSEEESDELMDANRMFALPGSGGTQQSFSGGFKLPGSTSYVDDGEHEESNDDAEETDDGDWENHRDPRFFMAYISNAYPSGIPEHDGTSTLGCEKAILYLNNLNKEISEALRLDVDDVLDLQSLEEVRVNMVKDVMTLKEHMKSLNEKHKKAFNISELKKLAGFSDNGLVKEAVTAKLQVVITPWERAVTGIIVNSIVSGGKAFEDVYEYLKKKYEFTPREELSILQILMDMGQPIFKDRGTIGGSIDDFDKDGVEFIKNYFA